jgi:hypothetical protein
MVVRLMCSGEQCRDGEDRTVAPSKTRMTTTSSTGAPRSAYAQLIDDFEQRAKMHGVARY